MAAKKRGPNRATLCPLLKMGKVANATNGFTIVNATHAMLLNITQRAIDEAVPGDAYRCVVAIALHNALGDRYTYEISSTTVKVIDEEYGVMLRFALPAAMQRAIKKFDRPGRWKGLWDLAPGVYRLPPLAKSQIERADGRATTKITTEGGAGGKTIVRRHARRLDPIRVIPRRFIRRRGE